MRVLMIDDEQVFFRMAASVLTTKGYELEYAPTGKEGLAKIAAFIPEIIITDMRLPDMSGFDILQSLRRDPRYQHIPVIFVTSVKTLEEKLKAFELGADDYLTKPFEPEELAARLEILARRAKASQNNPNDEQSKLNSGQVIVVHSLRGGSGVSSIAANLAIANYQLWEKPTLLIDSAIFSGQVSTMLNIAPKLNLGRFADLEPSEIDASMIAELIMTHKSGINFIAAPRFPVAADAFNDEFWNILIHSVIDNYSCLVIDTSHDFSDSAISILMKANIILLIVNPELASLKVAVSALKTYEQLGIPPDTIKLVLNQPFPNLSIDRIQFQKAIGKEIEFDVPYEPIEVLRAINLGNPFILNKPDIPISKKIEDMAYALSSGFLKFIPPSSPTKTWKRVSSRLPSPTKKT